MSPEPVSLEALAAKRYELAKARALLRERKEEEEKSRQARVKKWLGKTNKRKRSKKS